MKMSIHSVLFFENICKLLMLIDCRQSNGGANKNHKIIFRMHCNNSYRWTQPFLKRQQKWQKLSSNLVPFSENVSDGRNVLKINRHKSPALSNQRRTNRWSKGPTYKAAYRIACTWLKTDCSLNFCPQTTFLPLCNTLPYICHKNKFVYTK